MAVPSWPCHVHAQAATCSALYFKLPEDWVVRVRAHVDVLTPAVFVTLSAPLDQPNLQRRRATFSRGRVGEFGGMDEYM